MRCSHSQACRIPPDRNAEALRRIWRGSEARYKANLSGRRSSVPRCVAVAFGIAFILGPAPLGFSQEPRARDWASLDRQAEELYNKGGLKEAIRTARLALDAASNPQQSGRSLDRLGFFEYTSGNLKDAESFLRQSLELRRNKLGI